MFRSARVNICVGCEKSYNKLVRPKAPGRRCMATAFYEGFGMRMACTDSSGSDRSDEKDERSSRVDK